MILFRAGRSLTLDDELYVADVSEASPTPPVALTLDTDDIARRWAWSADGRSVVFRTTGSLSVARVACGAIVSGPQVVSTQSSLAERLSPEGDELVYLERIDAQTAALWRADLTVTPPAVTQMSEPGGITADSLLAWSPTAPRVAFRTNRRLEVLDGTTGAHSVVNGPLVTGGRVRAFAWSPDGQSAPGRRSRHVDVEELDLVDVDLVRPIGDRPTPRVAARRARRRGRGLVVEPRQLAPGLHGEPGRARARRALRRCAGGRRHGHAGQAQPAAPARRGSRVSGQLVA